MVKQRTIKITLTESQFKALGEAVAHWETDTYEQVTAPSQRDTAVGRALGNAWDKIKEAWYA
jgi:hypothetical protein